VYGLIEKVDVRRRICIILDTACTKQNRTRPNYSGNR